MGTPCPGCGHVIEHDVSVDEDLLQYFEDPKTQTVEIRVDGRVVHRCEEQGTR